MAEHRGRRWGRSAALAAGLALVVAGVLWLAQKSAVWEVAPVNPTTIPADVRSETRAEAARSEALFAAALGMEARGDPRAAEPSWREAVALFEASWGPRHPVTAIGLSNLGVNLNEQGRYADAEPLHRRALAIREARLGADHPDTADSLNSLAQSLGAQGRYTDAEPLLRRALAIREARLGANHLDTARSLNDLAENLQDQRRDGAAEPLLRRALAIREARLGADHPDAAESLNNLAANLDDQGRYAAAEPLFRRAVAIREARLGEDHPLTAESLKDLALHLYIQGRYADAEPLYRRALAISEARLGADHPLTALSLRNLARVELCLSKLGMALTHARAALRVHESARVSADAATVEETRSQLAIGSGMAAVMFARAAWSAAVGQPAQASALRAEAFAAAQAMGMSSAADALAQGAARVAAERAGAGAAVAAWRGAQDRLAAMDAQIANAAAQGAAGDARRAALGTERATALTQLVAAERDLSRRFPRYFDLLKIVPLSVADLQATTGDNARLLGADEALVLLTPGEVGMPEGHRRGLVFVVTKQTVAWAEIPLEPGALAAEIAALHAMLADPDAGKTLAAGQPAPSVTYDRTRAFALYRALFGAPEIAAALAGRSRWLIAPQGPLMSLPVAALPIAAPPGGAAADADPAALRVTAWLGTERTLAVLPSVSTLRVQRIFPLSRGETASAPFFGLGDPAFRGVADADVRRGGPLGAARSYFRGGVADLTAFGNLPRLPNTAREIRTLATNLGAGADSYVLQLNASEAELRRRNADGRLARADVIAFATHGLLAGEFDAGVAEPALALTPPVLATGAAISPNNDGLLTASQAATLSLSARFVILSACNTASGGRPDADALSGLARAFFYAGAQSLLVSHYPVYDDAAMRLTTEAVRLARTQNLRNPEAMRASMLALRQNASADPAGRSFAHPAAWAPFAVIDAN